MVAPGATATVVDSGSVSLSRDGVVRAPYVVVEDGPSSTAGSRTKWSALLRNWRRWTIRTPRPMPRGSAPGPGLRRAHRTGSRALLAEAPALGHVIGVRLAVRRVQRHPSPGPGRPKVCRRRRPRHHDPAMSWRQHINRVNGGLACCAAGLALGSFAAAANADLVAFKTARQCTAPETPADGCYAWQSG